MTAGQGSIAFAGFVRIVVTVGRLPDDPDVAAVACAKCNIGPWNDFRKNVLTFEINKLKDLPGERDRSKFTWGELVTGVEAGDIIKQPENGGTNEKEEAEKFLQDILDEHDEMDIKKLEVMAEKRGISRRTLQRAGEAVGVTKRMVGFGKNKVSMWSIE